MKITNKFIKFLVILNGVMLPILLGFGIYQVTKNIFPKQNRQQDGIILGKELETAKKDSLALQGLKYYSPTDLYNSNNKYLPISLLTYEEEKEIYKTASVANDIGDALLKYVNVIFLDENYQVITSLLDKKASILEIEPQRKRFSYREDKLDKTVKYIAYLIAFEDSNKDRKINSADYHDLYLSTLDGKNLRRVSENINIERFEFINSNTQIFIKFTSRENIREEHKKQRFAIYDIESSKFLNMSSLENEIDKLEKIIIN
ncbi:hypothetical protein BW723_03265 [Polaribacter reichenbachii]|uniref:EF-hand domain-containing protein n=1 Tax=Polaribacter reichenbachii TaxID=996801 RepID=A0A1B8TVW3_9FLAO|nr:hypothetical protein [Polaribacter reichenbachii]APZ45378.1 hypothetical protein BW723_03265 [Polaribacter reichenbachii]AUC19239.1 hypothetical protein BTO17_11270 [Polaribacter reichenbachii]OBY63605.1 hypothetical protein LPB301_12435 [Polaribacter reichenbachii]